MSHEKNEYEKKGLGAVESNEKGPAEADPCGSCGAVLNAFAGSALP